jgi:hypothetical protein
MITKEDTRSDDGRIARDAAVSVQLEGEPTLTALSLDDTAEEDEEEPSPGHISLLDMTLLEARLEPMKSGIVARKAASSGLRPVARRNASVGAAHLGGTTVVVVRDGFGAGWEMAAVHAVNRVPRHFLAHPKFPEAVALKYAFFQGPEQARVAQPPRSGYRPRRYGGPRRGQDRKPPYHSS